MTTLADADEVRAYMETVHRNLAAFACADGSHVLVEIDSDGDVGLIDPTNWRSWAFLTRMTDCWPLVPLTGEIEEARALSHDGHGFCDPRLGCVPGQSTARRVRGGPSDAEVRAGALAMYGLAPQLSMSGARDLARVALRAASAVRGGEQ